VADLTRVEVDTRGREGRPVGFDKPATHVITRDLRQGRAWVLANRPGTYPKVHHPHSEVTMRGLHLEGETVFVFHPLLSEDIRQRWAATGAHLVYL
jgi:hypothetical protein